MPRRNMHLMTRPSYQAVLDDWFGQGRALSADGATLAVGGHGEDSSATGINGDQADNSALNAGAVYVC